MPEDKLMKLSVTEQDVWVNLKTFTAARIALGRAGTAIPLKASLQFKLDHAHARDAVYSNLNIAELKEGLSKFQLPVYELKSMADNRQAYLQRPDFGRRLSEASTAYLQEVKKGYNIAIIIADGLSATAVNIHSTPLLTELMPMLKNYTIAPITVVEQGRVAIADEIGFLLKADISIILIGERPGLSAADSMGLYLTYKPTLGLSDECRNCISNIRTGGLSYNQASEKVFYFINESFKQRLSGVGLKDKEVENKRIDN